jgi:hypothetical protein
MKRIYHPYTKWEEYHAGMWRTVKGEEAEKLIAAAVEFTGDAKLYGKWMRRVVAEWPISCEHNLTCRAMNRQAWIGHAATCMAIGCPEDITRLAWHQLTDQQRNEANDQATEAIEIWEGQYAENRPRR